MIDGTVVVRGGGDLGSGVALRLWRVGFRVIILETAQPIAVRRTVSFSEAIYDGQARVEEALAVRTQSADDNRSGDIAVVVDPRAELLTSMRPAAVVDAILAKQNVGSHRDMARCVVGLGPGFTAGVDVHAVVETNRGPDLGRVIRQGRALPDTGVPAPVMGVGSARVLRAPRDGIVWAGRRIGDLVEGGDVLARVGGCDVRAPFTALLRGLVRDGVSLQTGMKLGDLDPRLDPSLCYRVSDKSLAIAGGVLEAVLQSLRGGPV